MTESGELRDKSIFIDSNCWFKSKKDFYSALSLGHVLVINTIVIYEVIKVLDIEIHLALEKKKDNRVKLLQSLKNRFPRLLKELDVLIVSTDLSDNEITGLNSIMNEYDIDIGDAIIYWTMKREKIKMIMINDLDWKRLPNIKVFNQKTAISNSNSN